MPQAQSPSSRHSLCQGTKQSSEHSGVHLAGKKSDPEGLFGIAWSGAWEGGYPLPPQKKMTFYLQWDVFGEFSAVFLSLTLTEKC